MRACMFITQLTSSAGMPSRSYKEQKKGLVRKCFILQGLWTQHLSPVNSQMMCHNTYNADHKCASSGEENPA